MPATRSDHSAAAGAPHVQKCTGGGGTCPPGSTGTGKSCTPALAHQAPSEECHLALGGGHGVGAGIAAAPSPEPPLPLALPAAAGPQHPHPQEVLGAPRRGCTCLHSTRSAIFDYPGLDGLLGASSAAIRAGFCGRWTARNHRNAHRLSNALQTGEEIQSHQNAPRFMQGQLANSEAQLTWLYRSVPWQLYSHFSESGKPSTSELSNVYDISTTYSHAWRLGSPGSFTHGTPHV